MGIDYGICTHCTPAWVFEEARLLEKLKSRYKKITKELFAEETADLKRRKREYRDNLAKDAQVEYDLAFEAGRSYFDDQP